MLTFRCPRCGGHYFGTICRILRNGVEVRQSQPGDEILIDRYECHSTTNGQGEAYTDGPPCGWTGSAAECLIEEAP